jgi:hypothetical protein
VCVQVDGEPWIQEPAQLVVTLLKTQVCVWVQLPSSPAPCFLLSLPSCCCTLVQPFILATLLSTAQAVVLRRVAGSPANQRLAVARELVGEVLASSEASGLITAQQRGALNSALSSALEPLMHGQL